MADWLREVTLQKVYGMGQTEAQYWAEREAGLTIDDSARMHGVSYFTVRTMLQRARMKVSGENDGGWDSLLIVLKGTEGDIRDAVKMPAMLTLMRFASKVQGLPVHEGRFLYAMPVGHGAGDIGWMKDNVFKYCDPVGTVIQDVERVSDRMVELYEKAGGTPDRMGIGVLRYWLDQWFMRYDVWEAGE